MPEEDLKRFAYNMSQEERYRLQDFAFLLKKTETDLVREAITAYLDAVANKKGEKFQTALEVVKEAREE